MCAFMRVSCVIQARLVSRHTARFMHKLCAPNPRMLPRVSCATAHARAFFLLLVVRLTSALECVSKGGIPRRRALKSHYASGMISFLAVLMLWRLRMSVTLINQRPLYSSPQLRWVGSQKPVQPTLRLQDLLCPFSGANRPS